MVVDANDPDYCDDRCAKCSWRSSHRRLRSAAESTSPSAPRSRSRRCRLPRDVVGVAHRDPLRVACRWTDRGLADSRVVLLIHGGDELDFDWARASEAITNGCVVVSETSNGFAPLVPGVHFVMAPYENVVEQAVALAFDEPRRAMIAEAARAVALPQPASPPPSAEPPAPRSRSRRGKPSGSQDNTLQQMVTELKVAIVAQRELTRSIEATISLVEHGDPDHADIISTSAWSSFDAEVSVVVPLFNEGRRLRDTVDSVIAASGASGPRTELLIIDDHSTDDSRDVAERLLAEIDWFPATLLARAATGGPAVARNVGFDTARAPHVLALDCRQHRSTRLHYAGCTTVSSRGTERRRRNLRTRRAFRHRRIARSRRSSAVGHRSAGARRVRRSGRDVPAGGLVATRSVHHADRRRRRRLGRLRPVALGSRTRSACRTRRLVIGRRREPLASMLNVSEIDTASTFITLRERHPRLPWPS